MADITLLPSAKVPLIYPDTSGMTTEWYRFFWNVYGFTGDATGAVPVSKGGTGLTSIGEHQLIIGNAAGVFEKTELIGSGITITYAPGTTTLAIGNSGVTPGTYGSTSAVGQFTVDSKGTLVFAQNVPIAIDATQIISGTIASARISGSYTGITGVGTLTAGTWNATTIDTAYGGTGLTSFTSGGALYATSTSVLTSGTLPTTAGGTGLVSFTSGGALYATSTSALTSGTLPVTAGGTGQTSFTNGQLLIGNTTGNTLTKATLTAGSGVSITNGTGSITISATGLGGTVTSVSVVSANGFAGTVATATTTPAITLSTTITGLLKGNGTAISAATSGTDYAPATSGTSILYGNGAGGFSNVTIGTGVSFTGGTLSATGSGGTVTSVTGTSPVVSSGGTTPAISLATAYGDTLNPYASKTANYFLAAPNGSAGVPTFRAIVAADIPALSYVTSVSGTGTVNGITLTGTVTSSGSLTLGGTLGGIGNSQLTNSTISGVALGGSLFNLTAGTGVSFSAGTTYNGSAAITINATGTGGTVTSVAALTLGTTGTDLSSTVANGTTTPVITLNVPTASAANRGALSAADWTTFNGKQAALVSGTNIKTVGGVSLLGSGDVGTIGVGYGGTGTAATFTAGSVVFAGASGVYSQNNAQLFWDNTNTRLGVGTATPGYKLSLGSTVGNRLAVYEGGGGANMYGLGTTGTGAGGDPYRLAFYSNGSEFANIGSGGNFGIGLAAATNKLTVFVAPAGAGNTLDGVVVTSAATNGAFAITGAAYSAYGVGGSELWLYSASILTLGSYGNNATKFVSNGAERMRIFGSGGVSIGNTTDPGATNLSVTGSVVTSQTAGIIGTTTNNDANAGSIGEYVTASVAIGSAVSLTTNVSATITSISLTAGDWDVWGMIGLNQPAATVVSYVSFGAGTSSSAVPAGNNAAVLYPPNGTAITPQTPIIQRRLSLSTTTTVYLNLQAGFTTSTLVAFGFVAARRRR